MFLLHRCDLFIIFWMSGFLRSQHELITVLNDLPGLCIEEYNRYGSCCTLKRNLIKETKIWQIVLFSVSAACVRCAAR